jgi:hypothetical protein
MGIPIQSHAYDNNINIAASPTRLVGITLAPSALSRKRKPDQWVRGMGERSRWMRPHGPFHKTAGLAFLSGGRCGHRVCPLCVVVRRCLRGVLARARRGRRVIAVERVVGYARGALALASRVRGNYPAAAVNWHFCWPAGALRGRPREPPSSPLPRLWFEGCAGPHGLAVELRSGAGAGRPRAHARPPSSVRCCELLVFYSIFDAFAGGRAPCRFLLWRGVVGARPGVAVARGLG